MLDGIESAINKGVDQFTDLLTIWKDMKNKTPEETALVTGKLIVGLLAFREKLGAHNDELMKMGEELNTMRTTAGLEAIDISKLESDQV